MNMAKKQNSFSSTKRDRNGETVPAIAGVEINEIRTQPSHRKRKS